MFIFMDFFNRYFNTQYVFTLVYILYYIIVYCCINIFSIILLFLSLRYCNIIYNNKYKIVATTYTANKSNYCRDKTILCNHYYQLLLLSH